MADLTIHYNDLKAIETGQGCLAIHHINIRFKDHPNRKATHVKWTPDVIFVETNDKLYQKVFGELLETNNYSETIDYQRYEKEFKKQRKEYEKEWKYLNKLMDNKSDLLLKGYTQIENIGKK